MLVSHVCRLSIQDAVLMLAGSEPPPPQAILASLESAARLEPPLWTTAWSCLCFCSQPSCSHVPHHYARAAAHRLGDSHQRCARTIFLLPSVAHALTAAPGGGATGACALAGGAHAPRAAPMHEMAVHACARARCALRGSGDGSSGALGRRGGGGLRERRRRRWVTGATAGAGSDASRERLRVMGALERGEQDHGQRTPRSVHQAPPRRRAPRRCACGLLQGAPMSPSHHCCNRVPIPWLWHGKRDSTEIRSQHVRRNARFVTVSQSMEVARHTSFAIRMTHSKCRTRR
ncbi:hypothetical protein GGX14DRAFT_453958 [Mycena pura]|uniref:Uncharacterized protein n=1 Tax=Mycena pura TaxID=153505 RepID=A0AAD6VE23_9AGAR|nr:hypothetical protein GGX14DRAFT_453958 [Mycena pura]